MSRAPGGRRPGARAATPPALVALLAVLSLGGLGLAADLTWREGAREAGRADVRSRLEAQARALAAALHHRLALVDGLGAWLSTTPTSDLARFDLFAAALAPSVEGVRAVQIVENGVIVRSWPAGEAGGLVGFDLRTHPDERTRNDVLRAERSDSAIVTPSPALLQGGVGFVARRRVPGPAGEPTRVATVVADLQPVLDEAGLAASDGELELALTGPGGRMLFGEEASAGDALVVPVPVAGETWRLAGRPVGGWRLPGAGPLRIAEAFGLATMILGGVLAYGIAARSRRLEGAVRQRTGQLDRAHRDLEGAVESLTAQDERLAMALRAGGVTTWEWDLVLDEVRHFPGSIDEIEADPETGAVSFSAVASRVHVEDLARFREAERRTRTVGADFDVEYRIVLPDGRTAWRHDAGRVSEDGTKVRGAVADVTRSKELEEQLAHARKMEAIGQLAGGIAHDFNNLMQVILGHVALLRDDVPEQEPDDGLDEIGRAAEHASRLTAQLLAFSRRRPVRPEPLRLGEEVANAASMLRRLLGPSVDLCLDLDPDEAVVLMDPSQLTQVLVNLGVNARDAMPGGGKLTLRTRLVEVGEDAGPLAPGAYGSIEVADEGEGIPLELLPRIFDPFFTTKAPGQGTGLGLASVYGAVRQAEGDVTVASVPGRGTTFRILLPLVPAEGPLAAQE